jgi:hypothetical protein
MGLLRTPTYPEANNVTNDIMIQCEQTLVLEMSIGRDKGW